MEIILSQGTGYSRVIQLRTQENNGMISILPSHQKSASVCLYSLMSGSLTSEYSRIGEPNHKCEFKV